MVFTDFNRINAGICGKPPIKLLYKEAVHGFLSKNTLVCTVERNRKYMCAIHDALFLEELQQLTHLDSISNSQLGRQLNQVPTEFFQQIFFDLVAQIHRKTEFEQHRKISTPLKNIDSSTLPLNLNNHKWAKFRKTKSGVKLYLRLVYIEKDCSYPDRRCLRIR